MKFTAQEVFDAYDRIKPYIPDTPLYESVHLGDGDRRYFFKLECLQPVKSFKIRGALNKMLTLTEEEKARGFGRKPVNIGFVGSIRYYKENVKLGFIGSIRNLCIARPALLGEVLTTSIEVMQEVMQLTLVNATVKVGDETIVTAEMKIALSDIDAVPVK